MCVVQTLSLRVHQPEAELHQPAESIITRLVHLVAGGDTVPRVMVSALKALASLCVGLGYAPRLANQKTVSDAGGLERLLELSRCDKTADDIDDETALVHVEASLAFAVVQIGIKTDTLSRSLSRTNSFVCLSVSHSLYQFVLRLAV